MRSGIVEDPIGAFSGDGVPNPSSLRAGQRARSSRQGGRATLDGTPSLNPKSPTSPARGGSCAACRVRDTDARSCSCLRGPSRRIFEGRTEGKIVPARGPSNFGWDPVFEPEEGNGLTCEYVLRVLLEEEVAQLVECAIPMRDLVLVCEVHLVSRSRCGHEAHDQSGTQVRRDGPRRQEQDLASVSRLLGPLAGTILPSVRPSKMMGSVPGPAE
jgi:hypothetical protein